MAYPPIEDHGVIGNLHTVALVALDGCIDFMCFPDFDSPTIFASLLDDRRGGRFRLAPILCRRAMQGFHGPARAGRTTHRGPRSTCPGTAN